MRPPRWAAYVGRWARAGQLVLLAFVCAAATPPRAVARWSTEFGSRPDMGSEAWVRSAASFHGELFLAGWFGSISGTRYGGVAAWDGSRWQPFGEGFERVSCLAIHDGKLVIGGGFGHDSKPPRYVALWDGEQWLPLGNGPGDAATALVSYQGKLIAACSAGGGLDFHNKGSVWEWDGSRWTRLGTDLDASPTALAVQAEHLYAGGAFDARVAVWDGTGWRPLAGLPRPVVQLVSSREGLAAVVAPGRDWRGDAASDTTVYVWRGDRWNPLLSRSSPKIAAQAIATFRGDLVAADVRGQILRWTGTDWTPLGSRIQGRVANLCEHEGHLYAVGQFSEPAGSWIGSVLVLADGDWRFLTEGNAPNGSVEAFAPDGEDLLVAGGFRAVGGIASDDVATWNGSAWKAVGDKTKYRGAPPANTCGLGGGVQTITVFDGSIIAGSGMTDFTRPRRCQFVAAKLEDDRWVCMGGPAEVGEAQSPVGKAFAVYKGHLIAAGRFLTIGGVVMNSIARWNGQEWEPLGGGLSAPPLGGCPMMPDVQLMCVFGGKLIVGGYLLMPGDSPQGLAAWDGTAWGRIAGGPTDPVDALTVWQDRVVASGTRPPGHGRPPEDFVRAWDGTAWTALDRGLDGHVTALCSYRDDLVAAVIMLHPGGASSALRIWNGSSWQTFAGNEVFDGAIHALCEYKGDLYVGGDFGRVGDIPSAYLARWIPE